eukprot:5226253-Ditylum_brightwellii.AAC.1
MAGKRSAVLTKEEKEFLINKTGLRCALIVMLPAMCSWCAVNALRRSANIVDIFAPCVRKSGGATHVSAIIMASIVLSATRALWFLMR